jgi:hypothetical protein
LAQRLRALTAAAGFKASPQRFWAQLTDSGDRFMKRASAASSVLAARAAAEHKSNVIIKIETFMGFAPAG